MAAWREENEPVALHLHGVQARVRRDLGRHGDIDVAIDELLQHTGRVGDCEAKRQPGMVAAQFGEQRNSMIGVVRRDTEMAAPQGLGAGQQRPRLVFKLEQARRHVE